MSIGSETMFEAFLNQHDGEAWAQVIIALEPDIHEVDWNATWIWYHFFPLALARAVEETEDLAQLTFDFVLQGNPYLRDQIDSSHTFLYGHRFWPEVKKAAIEHCASPQTATNGQLADHIREVAGRVSEQLQVERSVLTGITAVAFMTLQQVGLTAFRDYPGTVKLESKVAQRTPEQILAARAKEDRQRVFDRLRYPDKVWTITFNENDPRASFKLINTQQLTTAAAADKRPYHLRDPRCTPEEGPIPVQCRSAACGTCWVGILSGSNNLSPVDGLESRRIKEFGYIDTVELKPLIRLACQAQACGPVSIVIPPWNGVLSKLLRRREDASAAAEGSG